ncbi:MULTISPECIES: hypothetical protein [Bradyrhizobium]|uniref:hypothetical protein n=1 Tax=Bradyrhizobium TaxID=374 RepID=UPI00211EE965|nr:MULTISPECIES: hypothetical protein [Bradyrhizobium]
MSSQGIAATSLLRRDETIAVAPILAIAVGIVIAAWLRRDAGARASAISTLAEILLPMIALLIVLVRCEAAPSEASS